MTTAGAGTTRQSVLAWIAWIAWIRDKNDGDVRKQRLQVMGVFSSSPDCIISVVLHLLTLVRTPETAAFNRESIVMLDSRRPNKPLLPHPKETQLFLARMQLRLRLGN